MLEDYSNPHEVYRRAHELFGPHVMIKPSTHKTKKYMLYNPYTHRWIHFGQYGMEDYTKHKNYHRLQAFRIRNQRWVDEPVLSAAWLSYHLLW